MKKENIKTNDNIEKIGKVLEEKKKIPKNIKEKINSKRFENIAFGAVIIIYFFALNLGMSNIPTENYLTDLKVFSVFLLIHQYSKFYNTFGTIIFSASALCIIYYGIKILIMKKVIIKSYNKSLVDIGDIVKERG